MSTRVMHGLSDLQGRTINGLKVVRMVSRNPSPRYETQCEVCSAKRVFAHAQITSGVARCIADGCGRAKVGEHLRETAKSFRRQLEAEEEARRLETEAREREAADKARAERFEEQKRKSREFLREQVLTGEDVQLYVTPELQGLSMPKAEADAFNKAESDLFIQQTPEYLPYKTNESADAILAYFTRNRVRIFDAATIKAAFVRLKDLGIIQPRSVTPPEKAPEPKPNVTPNMTIARPTSPQMFRGIDPLTGLEREYTKRQVDGMSAHEYKRCFPTVGTMAELLTMMREQRSNA